MTAKQLDCKSYKFILSLYVITVVGVFLLNSPFASAQDYYWNVSSGDWSTAANWNTGIEPSSSNFAYIQNGGTANITQSGEACLVLSLGKTNSGRIEMTGGDLSTSGEYVGDSGMGTFIQNGGANNITSELRVGNASGSNGTYNLSGTGQLNITGVYCMEYIGYSGTGTFTQTGGTNSSSFLICVGYHGTGIYNHSAGTTTTNKYLSLGDGSDSNGTYNLSGTGQLSATIYEYIGYSGTGIFSQSGGTNTIGDELRFAYMSSAKGIYNFTGGTLILKSLSKGSGTAAFNFGGGTLQASGAFSSSLPLILTGTGGNAKVDTAVYDVTLSGILSGTGGLNKLGSGTLTLSGSETYSGNTTVNGGTLIFSGGISAGGTSLIDVESGSAVFKTTNISKTNLNVYTAASATFEVLNGSHQLGAIEGSGATRIDDGAALIVSAIRQGGLYIGSGAKLTIQGTSGNALDQDVIASMPEPGTWTLLSSAFIGLLFYIRRRRK